MSGMKKTMWLTLPAVLVLYIVLSGCTVPVSSGSGIHESTVPEDTGEEVTLKWYLAGSGEEPDIQRIMEEVNKYLDDIQNVTLELNVFTPGDDYNRKINALLAAREQVDIVFTSNMETQYSQNATSGYFTKLNGYLDKYPAIRRIVGEKFLNGSAVNGKHYAVPANKEKAHNWGFLLKKSLVDKYNMDVNNIISIEELEPFLDIIKDNETGITPLLIAGMDSPFRILDWDYICDEDVPGALYPNNRGTTITNQFLTSESRIYYSIIRDWFNKGYIHEDSAIYRNQYELMKSGKYFAVGQFLMPGRNVEVNAATGINWVQVDITKPVISNREATDALLAIPVGSRNPEQAFRFIGLLYTDQYILNLLNYGIEDIHYTKISENVVRLSYSENSGYNPGYGLKFGDCFKNFLTEGEDLNKWNKIDEYNHSGILLNSLGFVFDRTDFEIQISACRNVVQAYCKELFSGSVEVAPTVKQFEEELKIAGADELITEMQRQYDAWREMK